MATILTPMARPQSATVRPHSKAPLERDASRPVCVECVDAGPIFARDPRVVEKRLFPASRGLADARVVVAGGRGLRTKAGFAPLEKLARQLNAEVGASREAVDRGWIDYPHQVGLSGRTIAPEVYIAFGISGAIQHLAGMQTSKRIIAIDSDPDAPIFAVSDLAIRGDLFELLPRLIGALGDRGAKE